MPKGRIREALLPIKKAHEATDAWLQSIPEEKQREIPCKRGCDYCCHQFTTISIPESLYCIEELFFSDSQDSLLKKQNQLMKQQLDFVKEFTGEKLDEYRVSWFEKQFPCVFLDQDLKTCRIYKRRPVTCRAYLVIGDKELCKGPALSQIKIVNPAYPAMQIISASIAVSRELKIPANLFPIPLAIVWALYAYNFGVSELRKAMKGGTK